MHFPLIRILSVLFLVGALTWGSHAWLTRHPPSNQPPSRQPTSTAAAVASDPCATYPAYVEKQWGAKEDAEKYKERWPPFCAASARGVWKIEYGPVTIGETCESDAEPPPDNPKAYCRPTAVGTYELVFVRASDGRILDEEKPEPSLLSGSIDTEAAEINALEITRLSDYDGDGVVEILVHFHSVGEGWYPHNETKVYTVRGDVIVPYPPLKDVDIDKATDVDGDGRIDLITFTPFFGTTGAADNPDRWRGPPLLLHAQPDGSFRRDSKLAFAQAKKGCPTVPKEILHRDEKSEVDWESTFKSLACARLYGASTETLRASIAGICKEPLPGKPCVETRTCEICEVAAKWTKAEAGLNLLN